MLKWGRNLNLNGLEKEMGMVKLLKTLVGGLAGLFLLSGCNLPNQVAPQDGNLALTFAVQTIQAEMTQESTGIPVEEPTATFGLDPGQQPTITIAPTNTPIIPTATTEPCDVAGFIRDVTIEDGTEMMPGTSFTKTWRVLNEGGCTWTKDYDIIFERGESMDGLAVVQLTTGNVSPGSQFDMSVDLVAPDNPGTYRGYWQIRNANGVVFTLDGFWVEIEVLQPVVYSSKINFEVEQTYMADLDEGDSPSIEIEDFLFKVVSDTNKRLVPMNSAQFVVFGEDEPSYGKCNEADLDTDEIVINQDLVEQWICYETNEGRLGTFQVVSLKPSDVTASQVLELDYVTWAQP